MAEPSRRIAYLSLQAVAEGHDSHATVLEIIEGFEARGWRVDRWFPTYRDGVIPRPFRRVGEMLRLQRGLRARLRDYDAVYIRQHPGAWPLARAAARAGVPVVQECNGMYEDIFVAWPITRLIKGPILRSQVQQFRIADAVVAVTPGIVERIERDTGSAHVVLSPNGANTEIFRPDAPKRAGLPSRYAVFFGRLAPWQGLDILVDAVWHPNWPDGVALVVVGDGRMRPLVEDAADGERLIYVGQVPYAELAGIAAHAIASMIVKHDVVVTSGGLSPLKLYESMACGVPIVASDWPGLADTIREVGCGLVVPRGDIAETARAVATLAADPAAAAEMGRRGAVAAIAEHSWAARAAQRADVVEQAIRSRRPA